MIRLHCALRAGSEHRNLHSIGFRSQFKYVFPDGGTRHIMYIEDLGIKTNKGGLRQKKIHAKQVTIFLNETDHTHCPVWVFYKYYSKHPIKRIYLVLYLWAKKFCWTWWGVVPRQPNWCEQTKKLCERCHKRSWDRQIFHEPLIEIHCCNLPIPGRYSGTSDHRNHWT